MEIEELSQHGVSEHSGFPNAATDSRLQSLDLTKLLVRHPSSTFYIRVVGNGGSEFGVKSGDIAVVDRSLQARRKDLIIWWDDAEFVITQASELPPELKPWGVVTYVIHEFRGKRVA